MVDGVFKPVGLMDRRRRGGDGFDESPVFLPLRAFLNPLAELGDFGSGQPRTVLGLGHDDIRVGGGDAFDQLGRIGIAGDEGAVAGFACGEGFFPEHERDAAGLFHAAVTGGAVAGEDWADVTVEIDLIRRCGEHGDG